MLPDRASRVNIRDGRPIQRASPTPVYFMPAPVLPLPLTAFERYMLDDDRADYPMTYPMELRFSGEICRPALEAAIDETLGRHPLLCARIEYSKHCGLCFVQSPGLRPPLDWDLEGVPLRFPNGRAIDLTREAGIRLWVRAHDATATLVVQFHHACCDGVGAIRFIGDLLAAYAIRTAAAGPRPTSVPVEPEHLRTRGKFNVEYPEPVGPARVIWSTLCEAGKWIVRRPVPLAIPGPLERQATEDFGDAEVASHRFDEHQTSLLRQIASRSTATVNDLLLRDLFLTIREWNERFQPGGSQSWVQINMPQNLRARSDDTMPAANKMSYAFLTRRARDLKDPKVLLEGIRLETKAIKEWSLGLYFIAGLSVVQMVPGLCRRLARGKRCFATTVLSNLGDFGRHLGTAFPKDQGRVVAGNIRLDGCWIVPPVRPMTRAAMLALTYANCLNLVVHTDRRYLPPSATGELLTRYVEKVERTIRQTA